jgi:hypothetical protein
MKVLYWTDRYNGDKRNIIRKTTEVLSLKDFAVDHLRQLSFDELFRDTLVCSIEIYKENVQIRIPKLEYDQLRPQIKSVLIHNSLHIKDDSMYSGGYWQEILKVWRKTNYWEPCKSYIFDFDSYTIKKEREGGEYEDCIKIGFMQSTHPFIDEFISCIETRWGEAGEIQNIKKWKI